MFPRGVYIVTARHGDRDAGATVARVIPLASEHVGISLDTMSFTLEALEASGRFALHFLASDQVQLAKRFGEGSSRSLDKFDGLTIERGIGDVPILAAAPAVWHCEVLEVRPIELQRVVTGRRLREEIRLPGHAPLVFDPAAYASK